MILTPKPRVDVTPRSKSNPRPLSHCCSGKGAPDDIYLAFYTVREALDDIHWWHKDCIIERHTSPWTLSVGDLWQETGHTCKPQAHKGHTTKFKNLDPQAIAQWAACDIYTMILKWVNFDAKFTVSVSNGLERSHLWVLIFSWALTLACCCIL